MDTHKFYFSHCSCMAIEISNFEIASDFPVSVFGTQLSSTECQFISSIPSTFSFALESENFPLQDFKRFPITP